MTGIPRQPVLILLTSHWLSLVGIAVAGTAGFSWLFVLPIELRGHTNNPYIGIVAFILIPVVFVLGLVLIALGMLLARRRIARMEAEILVAADRRTAIRKLLLFSAVTTAVNIAIGTQGTYRAVQYMETVQFCGQGCHVMAPEFAAHESSPHARVACVDCHVMPGAVGWLESKMAGTRQLVDVVFNRFHRPIESALATNRLVPSAATCEQCHWPQRFDAVRLRVIFHFQDDATNTQTQTVLLMLTGGGTLGGIHGKHFGPGVEIHYAAADPGRQTIPWVEYRNRGTAEIRTYLADGSTVPSVAAVPRYRMQCVDCHNRPTHTFELPERAVDRAMALGRISTTLPFIKKKAIELLKADYASNDEASRKIPATLARYYQEADPTLASQRARDIASAGTAIAAIYNQDVFPDLKVTWGTYPNNLGHTDFPGCFRCHDGSHSTADQKMTITQDCGACHQLLAVDEANPAVLKTLGLADILPSLGR